MELTDQKQQQVVGDILSRHQNERGALIPVLQDIQGKLGYLPEEVLEEITRRMGIPLSRVYGVATFYAQFRLEPQGRHMIRVCHGTACHVGGATEVTAALEADLGVAEGETTEDRRYTLESVACLGCCSLAPVMTVDEDTHGRMDSEKSRKVIKRYE